MEELLSQIKKALDYKLYLVALQATLTILDICAKLTIKKGDTHKPNYIKWYEENIENKQQLTGEECYAFRCAMLHEGRMQHKEMEHSRIIFLVPNNNYIFSGNIFGNINGQNAINIDLPLFCNEMINCALKWWETNKNNETVKKNYEKIVKYHAGGLSPFIVGVPVIA